MDKNKGITLIVLIITVILLIILAGVTINFVGEGKIFDSAEEVVNRSEEQMNSHDQMVNDVRNMIIGDASEPGKDDSDEENPVCTTHIPGEWIIIDAATCTTTGTKVKKCTVCDTILETSIIAATGHSYGSWETTQAATCTVTGTQTRTCTKCGATQKQVIPKLGHSYVNHVCTRCGAKETFEFIIVLEDYNITMSFKAEYNTTWQSWVNTSYNTGEVSHGLGNIWVQGPSSLLYVSTSPSSLVNSRVFPNEIIQPGTYYGTPQS